jgi:CheY-like chemotaxis protein
LIEDDLSDIRLVTEALKVVAIQHNLNVVRDGVEALAFLRREDRYAYAPRPDIILLDLNLPKQYGQRTLAEIKGDPDFKRIPVIVLTTSDSEMNVLRAYELHANAYVVKPAELKQFIQVIKSITEFWLTVVRLPK